MSRWLSSASSAESDTSFSSNCCLKHYPAEETHWSWRLMGWRHCNGFRGCPPFRWTWCWRRCRRRWRPKRFRDRARVGREGRRDSPDRKRFSATRRRRRSRRSGWCPIGLATISIDVRGLAYNWVHQWGSVRCKQNVRWQHLSRMKNDQFYLKKTIF